MAATIAPAPEPTISRSTLWSQPSLGAAFSDVGGQDVTCQRFNITAAPLPPSPSVCPSPTFASGTCRPPASPRNCQPSSQTWKIPCAVVASPKERKPPLGLIGSLPVGVVAPLSTSDSASPGSQKPQSSGNDSS